MRNESKYNGGKPGAEGYKFREVLTRISDAEIDAMDPKRSGPPPIPQNSLALSRLKQRAQAHGQIQPVRPAATEVDAIVPELALVQRWTANPYVAGGGVGLHFGALLA